MRVPKAPGWSAIFAGAALLTYLKHERGIAALCLFLLAVSLCVTIEIKRDGGGP